MSRASRPRGYDRKTLRSVFLLDPAPKPALADAPEVDDSHDDEYVCTRSGYDFCDGDCKRCDERAADKHEDNLDSRREEWS